MKILIATNSYPTKKNPTHHYYVRNIYNGLKERGIDVDVIHNRYFDYFKSEVGSGSLITSIFKTLFIFFCFLPVTLFRAKKYDLIYSHAPVWPGFLMLAAQKIYNIKHVIYVHGSAVHYKNERPFLYKVAHFTLKRCSHIVTNSTYCQNKLLKRYNCESSIITPGYKASVFRYKEQERNIDIVFAGNASRQKGIDLFFKSITAHKNFYQEREIRIHVYFSGDLRKEMIDFAQRKDIDNLITFGDRLLEHKLADVFQHAKVVVLPSTNESLGLVGIEAIACGAILVGSNSGGIKEYLTEGKNGFLFEDGDVDDLHRAIKKALHSFDQFKKLQPSVSQSVHDFSLESAMGQTITMFENLKT